MGKHQNEECKALRKILRALLCCEEEATPLLRITAQYKGVSFTADGDIMTDFKDTDLPGSVTFKVSGPVDAKGKPAKLDGIPVWALDDGTNAQITEQSADGLSCTVHLSDNPSATQLTVTADADLGQGVVELQSQTVINIVAGDAVALGNISAGAVVPDSGNHTNPTNTVDPNNPLSRRR